MVNEEVATVTAIIVKEAVTDRQALYSVNNALLPRVDYRLSLTVLATKEANRITSKYTEAVRKKADSRAGHPKLFYTIVDFLGLAG